MAKTDALLEEIADYAVHKKITSDEAYKTARYVLLDAVGCGLLALRYPECRKHLGPIVPGTVVPNGARVPGTPFVLDPVQGAFNIGCVIRWLDYNDTWLAAEWGHPSDNLGGILAAADYESRRRVAAGGEPFTVETVLEAAIKAHEIQGILALENSLNREGLDHVLFVKVATAAVVTAMLGGTTDDVVAAVSQAWIDNASLRTYRHAPNTGSRKSWAAGDATSRGVRFALMTLHGEMGYPQAIEAPDWGIEDVMFAGKKLTLGQPLDSYVMENVLLKISYPAEFHAQTAAEAAIKLYPEVKDRIDDIASVTITTQESAKRIIDKTGPLYNPADRDHCIQYITAIGLIFGELTADYYEDDVAEDERIDRLRDKMSVIEDERYSREYLDADKRSIANAVEITFTDGSKTDNVAVEYPIGHRRRRKEGLPLLMTKFRENVASRLPGRQTEAVMQMAEDEAALRRMSVADFMNAFVL